MAEKSGNSLMSLNDNKAGMEGLDIEKINKIIETASQGTRYYIKKMNDQARVDAQISENLKTLSQVSGEQLEKARKEADKYVTLINNQRDLSRTIVHVDMDMFYVAVEMRDNPHLRDVPVAVGGLHMLSTSNYAARKYGVRAAMPGFIALKLCPSLEIVPCNMEKYAEASEIIQTVYREYDEHFQSVSLDEAYLDLTDYLELHPDLLVCDVVEEMRDKIFEKTKLTCSAGIAPNSFLAKVCSDLNKPNGQHYIPPDPTAILNFVSGLNIRKAPGIGTVQEQHLNAIGVKTCRDLWEKRGEIKVLFSNLSCNNYMQISQGIGKTTLGQEEDRERKSVSQERTFQGTADRDTLTEICRALSESLAEDLKNMKILGLSVSVKIKSHDFKLRTKASHLIEYSREYEEIWPVARRLLWALLDTAHEKPLPLRLIGVRLSELKKETECKSKQKKLESFFRLPQGKMEERDHDERPKSEGEDSPCDANQNFMQNISKTDPEPEDGAIPVKDPDSPVPGSSKGHQDGTQVVCPVCHTATFPTEAELSTRHIDNCLSRSEIREIMSREVHQPDSKTQAGTQRESYRQTGKRKMDEKKKDGKLKKLKIQTMDKFFSPARSNSWETEEEINKF